MCNEPRSVSHVAPLQFAVSPQSSAKAGGGRQSCKGNFFSQHPIGPEARCSGYSQTPPANVSTADAAIQFLRRARQIASLSCYNDTFLLGKKVDLKSAAVSRGVKAVLHLQQITPPPPHSLATEPSFRDRLMEVRSAPTRCTRRESANHFLYVPFTGKSRNFFFLVTELIILFL